jgi:exodeoxyribonuclease VIII
VPDKIEDDFFITPHMDRRTVEGRDKYNTISKLYPPESYVYIDEDSAEHAHAMLAALDSHYVEVDGVNIPTMNLLTGGKAEQSIFWKSEPHQILCKCRPDYLNDWCAVDYKTALNSSKEAFTVAVRKYRYDIQAAFYLDGIKAATGKEYKNFMFIVQEKNPPYEIGVYVISETRLETARVECNQALDTYAFCKEKYGDKPWPMRSHKIEEID